MIARPMPRHVLVVLAALAISAAGARADTLGLIVAGDPAKEPIVEGTLEPWLKQRGYQVQLQGANAEVVGKLAECFLVGTADCPDAVARFELAYTLFVMVQVQPDAATGSNDVKLTGWLYGHQRYLVDQSVICRACRNETLVPAVEALAKSMFAVAGGTGQLRVVSDPPGAAVTIDGDKAGATPWEQSVLAGAHSVTVERPGYRRETVSVQVEKDATATVDLALVAVRRRWPLTLVAAGFIAAGTGAVLLVLDEDCNDVSGPCATGAAGYRDTGTTGAILTGVGAAVIGAGVILYLRRGGRPARAAPTAWIDPARGGGVGVVGRF